MPSEDNGDLLCHEETHLNLFVKFYFHKMYLSLKFRNIIQPDGKEKLGNSVRRTVMILKWISSKQTALPGPGITRSLASL